MKLFLSLILILFLLSACTMPFFNDPFGELPMKYPPNCGPEERYKFNIKLDSKDNFINFIKTDQVNYLVKVDGFKESNEVQWDKVKDAVNVSSLGKRRLFSLTDSTSYCPNYTFMITNDGYVSVNGCCGKRL